MSNVVAVAHDDSDESVHTPEPIDPEAEHVLVLGKEQFVCGDKLPVSTLIRYADNGLMSMHFILVKLVPEEEHERMWDAFEELSEDDMSQAFGDLIESYSERPTRRPSSSSRGSRKTKGQ